MSDQTAENEQGGGNGLAGRYHEEVEEDQRVDPEQPIYAQINGDQGCPYGENAGQINARLYCVSGTPGIENCQDGRKHDY